MSRVEQARQACRDAAANLWQKLNMPGLRWQAELMRDGTGDAGPVVCAFVGLWNKAYAAGRDAERLRGRRGATRHKQEQSDCPCSPNGRHQIDTSMESGPHHCFYCEANMRPGLNSKKNSHD